ncbi:MAG: hypothetical protein ACREEM_01120 [Blastocatellia bacterium]
MNEANGATFDDADRTILAPAEEAPVEAAPASPPPAEAFQAESSPSTIPQTEALPDSSGKAPEPNPDAARSEFESAEKITGLIDIVSSHAESIAALRQTLESQRGELDSLRQWIAELERSNAAKIASAKPQQPVPVKGNSAAAPPLTRQAPFELVSIDHWNGEANAVIRAKGRLHTLKLGARLQEWTVAGIDATTLEVTFRNGLGQTARIARPVKRAEAAPDDR